MHEETDKQVQIHKDYPTAREFLVEDSTYKRAFYSQECFQFNWK